MTEAPLPPDELVSRYVDDDLPDELRQVVEADVRLLAEVARVRSLRTALRDVDPIDPRRADAALAAARTAYDAAASAAEPPARGEAPVVVPMRAARWRRTAAWAGAVAAAAVVAVAGAALLGPEGGRAPVADDQITAKSEQPNATDPSVAGVAEALAADSAAPGEADVAIAATEAPAAVTSPEPLGDDRTTEPFPLPPPGSPVVLDDPVVLQWFASSAEPVPVVGLDPADVPCLDVAPDLLLTANAIYAGTPAVIFLDEDSGEAIAYASDGCAVLAVVAR